jgi:hypothetical protein
MGFAMEDVRAEVGLETEGRVEQDTGSSKPVRPINAMRKATGKQFID